MLLVLEKKYACFVLTSMKNIRNYVIINMNYYFAVET